MTTLNIVSKYSEMVETLKLSDIKPSLTSINLMYVWAFKKKPKSGTTYVEMLEDIFDHLNNNHWIAMSPKEKFIQWIAQSDEVVSHGYDGYKEWVDAVLIFDIQKT